MSEPRELRTSYELFHVECGPGWKGLYIPLLKLCEVYGIRVMQVKEKFGGLRFYTGGYVDPARAMEEIPPPDLCDIIDAAEEASYHTCEECGTSGVERWDDERKPVYKVKTGRSRTSGWIRSLCDTCREALDQRREAEEAKVRARLAAKESTGE